MSMAVAYTSRNTNDGQEVACTFPARALVFSRPFLPWLGDGRFILKEADQNPYLRQSIIQNTGVKPRVSIIVVNWNGKALLKDCLGTLCHQTYSNKQIILVDNGSVDQFVVYVRETFLSSKPLGCRVILGLTGGIWRDCYLADGDFVALVNNDTRAQDHWLENLIQPMLEDSTVGICAPKFSSMRGEQIIAPGID